MLMAVACGVFVANIYYNQPILQLLQQAFPRAVGLVNLVPTATQLGFGCGLFLLAPLGDQFDRRKLILWQAAVLIVALVCLAAAPNAWSLVIASTVVGFSGSVPQQIVPFVADLAAPSRRGQVVGTVMSGVLCGILLGRAVGGFTADHLGWRATFWLAAAMTTIIWLVLLVKLPHSEPKTSHSYLGLMKSLMELWREELPLRRATCRRRAYSAARWRCWDLPSICPGGLLLTQTPTVETATVARTGTEPKSCRKDLQFIECLITDGSDTPKSTPRNRGCYWTLSDVSCGSPSCCVRI
jgi:MFS family permease